MAAPSQACLHDPGHPDAWKPDSCHSPSDIWGYGPIPNLHRLNPFQPWWGEGLIPAALGGRAEVLRGHPITSAIDFVRMSCSKNMWYVRGEHQGHLCVWAGMRVHGGDGVHCVPGTTDRPCQDCMARAQGSSSSDIAGRGRARCLAELWDRGCHSRRH